MIRRQNLPGFALVEVALALVVMGIVAGSLLGAYKPMRVLNAQKRTKAHLALVEKAIASYITEAEINLTQSGRRVGKSSQTRPFLMPEGIREFSRSSSIFVGTVPYATLGLREAQVKDGWGRPFLFVVIAPKPLKDRRRLTLDIYKPQVEVMIQGLSGYKAVPQKVPVLMLLISQGPKEGGALPHVLSENFLPTPVFVHQHPHQVYPLTTNYLRALGK